MFEGFEALSEAVGLVLSGLAVGTVVGFFSGIVRMWRR